MTTPGLICKGVTIQYCNTEKKNLGNSMLRFETVKPLQPLGLLGGVVFFVVFFCRNVLVLSV